MSFRKRHVVVAQPGSQTSDNSTSTIKQAPLPGVRASPLDGRWTISTGTRSLDGLLAGHAGLVLGTSLLIEESGTTDFGSTLLRYFAAEGIVQGHHVHVLGMDETWGRDLPGLSACDDNLTAKEERKDPEDKMKIAWRYERLGEFGAGARERPAPQSTASVLDTRSIFCHDFDLSKRLIFPLLSNMKFVRLSNTPSLDFNDPQIKASPFTIFLTHLATQLSTGPNSAIHRVIVPNLLSPTIYPAEASRPARLLQFLHILRALLRRYPAQLTVFMTLPLSLYPRSTGLTKWMELLSDGVLELAAFSSECVKVKAEAPSVHGEPPQGMLRIHRLPVFHEKGGGGGQSSGFRDDLAFTVSIRKGLIIKPFSLPPVEVGTEAQQVEMLHGPRRTTEVDIEF